MGLVPYHWTRSNIALLCHYVRHSIQFSTGCNNRPQPECRHQTLIRQCSTSLLMFRLQNFEIINSFSFLGHHWIPDAITSWKLEHHTLIAPLCAMCPWGPHHFVTNRIKPFSFKWPWGRASSLPVGCCKQFSGVQKQIAYQATFKCHQLESERKFITISTLMSVPKKT